MPALQLKTRWRICIPIEHFKYKNNSDHLLSRNNLSNFEGTAKEILTKLLKLFSAITNYFVLCVMIFKTSRSVSSMASVPMETRLRML